ncbi:hypothetical protein [Treponema sp.]|uniref:hypothetical protein n=1 Tax=Treponema sp. TaxID=166 RepID=UPI00388DDAB9
MSMDYRIPDPNKKITDKLVLDFARKSSDEYKNNSLTVLRDNGDSYTVLVTVKDEKTGEVTQREETISREAFETAVKKGYLKKQ